MSGDAYSLRISDVQTLLLSQYMAQKKKKGKKKLVSFEVFDQNELGFVISDSVCNKVQNQTKLLLLLVQLTDTCR